MINFYNIDVNNIELLTAKIREACRGDSGMVRTVGGKMKVEIENGSGGMIILVTYRPENGCFV